MTTGRAPPASSAASETAPLPLEMPASPVGSIRWLILFLVFFATTINYMDRLVMGILSPGLCDRYHITAPQYGIIQAFFAFTYAMSQMPAGKWIDKVGTRIGYAVTLVAWSIASMLHALMHSAFGFGVARVALGVSESPNFPLAVKTVAEWFPRRERALALGVVNAGSNVGAIVAPLVVPWLAINYGWQWAFIGTGAVGLIWVLLWLPVYRRPHEHPRVSAGELAWINSDAPEPATPVRWITLLTCRQTWAFAVGKFLTDPIWWFYMTWVPDFFSKRHGLNLKTIGVPLVVVYLMADLGSVGGGWLSSTLIRRGWGVNPARKLAMFVCAFATLPIVFCAKVHHLWAAVALLGLGTAAHQGWSSNLYTLVPDMFPRRACGSVAGIGGTIGYLGAALFSTLTGYLLVWTHHNYTIIFIIAPSSYLVAAAAVHLLAPRLEPVVIPAEPPGFEVQTARAP